MPHRCIAALLLVALACRPAASAETKASEAQLKGAFVVGFMRFVRWAPDAMPPPGAPFAVCIMDDSAVLAALVSQTGVNVQNRTISARSIDQSADLASCHVLYLGKDSVHDARVVTRALERRSILTVSDWGEGLDAAVIRFRLEGERLAFDVDLDAASEAHLDVGSQLLGVAHRVVRGHRGRP
jgi:hypothetical protein